MNCCRMFAAFTEPSLHQDSIKGLGECGELKESGSDLTVDGGNYRLYEKLTSER